MAKSVEIYAFNCGAIKTTKDFIIPGRSIGEPYSLPVPFFLLNHDGSWLAVDTGLHMRVAEDPIGHWGKDIVDVLEPVMEPEDAFDVQIKTKLNLEITDLDALILSHGHLDHAGSVWAFADTEVPIYVQKPEYEVIKEAVTKGVFGYVPGDFGDIDKLNWRVVEGVVDFFGDSSVIAFPSPGHTMGLQGVMAKGNNSKIHIIANDACDAYEILDEKINPSRAADPAMAMQALHMYDLMRRMGAEIIPGHDLEYWKNKPLAPLRFDL